MRSPGRLRSPAVQLGALGLLGMVLAAAVLGAALLGFHRVERADGAARSISQAQRYHQDADQGHDALHSDVLQVLRATEAGDAPARTAALQVLQGDVADYRANVQRAGRLPLPSPLSRALARLQPAQFAYADHALSLAEQVTSPGADQPGLAAFTGEFGQLQRAQGQVTDLLTRTESASQSLAETTQRQAVRNVLTAGSLVFAGLLSLLALSGSLARVGRRLRTMLRREHDVAETLQRSLLPDRLPDCPAAQLAARFLPCAADAAVGGDWYDAFVLPDGALALVIGDVTGHDIEAAAAMGQLRNALRACAVMEMDPAQVFDRLNDLMGYFHAQHLATCVYLRLPACDLGAPDPTAPVTVTVVNAGHCPPLVVTSAGRAHLLEAEPCLLLGALPDVRYAQHDYSIEPGSTLVLYTDGLIERRDQSLDTGFDLLLRAAAADSGAIGSPDLLCDSLLASLDIDPQAEDDVTLLAVTLGTGPARDTTGAGQGGWADDASQYTALVGPR